MSRWHRALAALAFAMVAGGQGPIANDPFQSVPAPQFRPRPAPAPPSAPATPRPAPAARPAASAYPVPVGQSFRDCAECPELVVLPAGSFVMGSPSSEEGRQSDEGPQRTVQVTAPLAVGKFEVTFAEWDACVGGGGCSHRPSDAGWGRGSRPVMNVSWEDAQQYVRWLSSRTGRRYRLLTEAEWEYAARAGTVTAYSFGSSIGPSQANFGSTVGRTQAVGSYPPNGFGLHDLHGNVWEWVEDCYVSSYAGAPVDASVAVTSGGCSARVLRGGSWDYDPQDLRAALRFGYTPGLRYNYIGFRVARTPGG
jgi:formylglycine-generating enzyme required for sulfatase activity